MEWGQVNHLFFFFFSRAGAISSTQPPPDLDESLHLCNSNLRRQFFLTPHACTCCHQCRLSSIVGAFTYLWKLCTDYITRLHSHCTCFCVALVPVILLIIPSLDIKWQSLNKHYAPTQFRSTSFTRHVALNSFATHQRQRHATRKTTQMSWLTTWIEWVIFPPSI